MKKSLLCAAVVLIVLPSMASATLQGISRVTDFTIYNNGSFQYNNTITVYNDQSYSDYMSGNWNFYTDDLSSVATTGMIWTGSYLPFTGFDPWQPTIPRTGYTRTHDVWVDAYSMFTYTLSYGGSAGSWNFGDFEGVYYGDGFGGAETPFNDFFFTLNLPGNATSFTILDQSSPYILSGTSPFVLDWHEQGVEGIIANVSFAGPNLAPVPEPGTMALFGIGLLGVAIRRRMKK